MTSEILEISHILNILLTSFGINESELSRKINVPRATINRLVSGRTPDPRASTLNAIADYFNVSVDQLLGKQPLFTNENKNLFSTVSASLPVIDIQETKNWETVIGKIKPEKHFDWIMIDPSIEKGHFAIRVQGESMWPQFQEKTLLIIDPMREPKNRDFVLAYIKENNEIIFRQFIVEGKYKFLKAINSIFPTIQIGNFDKIIGVVIQMRNSL